jgi:hypothetical protein
MTIMEANRPCRHIGSSGKGDRFVREPEALLAETDRPPFGRPGIKSARRDQHERPGDRSEGGNPAD